MSIVNSVRVDDWLAKLAIISSNVFVVIAIASFNNLYSHLLEEEKLQIAAFCTSGIVLLADNPKLFLSTFRFNSSLMINV